jgi:hypothetical protein
MEGTEKGLPAVGTDMQPDGKLQVPAEVRLLPSARKLELSELVSDLPRKCECALNIQSICDSHVLCSTTVLQQQALPVVLNARGRSTCY